MELALSNCYQQHKNGIKLLVVVIAAGIYYYYYDFRTYHQHYVAFSC